MSSARNYQSIPNGEPSLLPESSASSMSARSDSRGPSRRRPKGIYQGEATYISSVVNLVNTILGAGVLAMPLAMSHMGMTLGIVVIIMSGMISGFGLYLQSRCARYVERGTSSFFTLSQITYPSASIVFDLAIAIKCFGVGVSYLIIIGDLMPQVAVALYPQAAHVSFLIDRHFWVTLFMLVVIPLSFLRRLDSLKYTSFIALTSVAYLVVIVVGHFIRGDTIADRGKVSYFTWQGPVEFLSSFPIIVFGYTCHQNMFSIVNEIKDNSHRSTTRVVLTSSMISASTYIIVAVTGYLSFGNNVGGNIIAMYPQSFASTIGRAAIVVMVMFSYPLQAHPCRASIDHILKWRPTKNSLPHYRRAPGGDHGSNGDTMSDLRFAVITTIIIVFSYITAMTVDSLERVLAYVGSTGSTSISFILPGMFYWKISRPGSGVTRLSHTDDDDEDGDEPAPDDLQSSWTLWLLHYGAGTLAIYGILVMCLCLSMNFFFSAGGH